MDYVFGDFKGPIRRKTYSLLATRSCLVFKVFRFNGRPYCYSSVSFSSYYFFFLLHFSKTPGRIFMKFSGMVYIALERPKIIFRVMMSLPVRDINDFLIFRVLILFRHLLRNVSRYLLQIFTDSIQKIEVVQDMF